MRNSPDRKKMVVGENPYKSQIVGGNGGSGVTYKPNKRESVL